MSKKIKIFLLLQNKRPIKSVDGEHVSFSTMAAAKRQLRKWKEQGDCHVYGRDTFFIKDVTIVQI